MLFRDGGFYSTGQSFTPYLRAAVAVSMGWHGGGHDSALPVATTEFCNQARRRNLFPELRLSVGRSGDMPGRLYYHR